MKNKIISFLVLVLFIIAPFIQSDTSDESQPDIILSIPPFVSIIAFYGRWFIIGILVMYFIFSSDKIKKYITKYNVLFTLFYVVQFLYAMTTQTDVVRYLSLAILAFILPIVITSQVDSKKYFVKPTNFQKVVFFFTILSIIVSGIVVLSGLRFQGILGNANMYGISAVFWLTLIQLSSKTKFNLILSVVIFITILLSGSRGALVAGFVVILFSYLKYFKQLLIGASIMSLLIFGLSKLIDLSFIFGRFEDVGNSAAASGRQLIWDNAFNYINVNPLGYGMNAPLELINTGNIHNCYIRFLLTMGYPFTIFSLIFFFAIIVIAFYDKKAPKPIVGFLIGYALANYGEDFFVGIGSSMFIYVIFAIGLLSYYTIFSKKEI